jgi:hypothetical protein
MALSGQIAFWNGLLSQQHGWIISSGLTVMDRQQLFFKNAFASIIYTKALCPMSR